MEAMPEQNEGSSASRFLNEHPELREAMAKSQKFAELKKRKALPKDNAEDQEEEQLYVVRGDTVGDEDELVLDALARGANSETQDALARELFLEMDQRLQALVMNQLRR
jgi:hypothetical protein